jgi:hypothetical protein
MKKTFLAAVAACLSLPALASQWIDVAESSSYVAAVDKETMVRSPGHVTYWERRTYRTTRQTPDGKSYNLGMTKVTIDCTKHQWIGDSVILRMNGEMVLSIPYSQKQDILPDSVMQGEEKAICL